MSFRKRNVVVSDPSSKSNRDCSSVENAATGAELKSVSPSPGDNRPTLPGVRPSPLDGRPTTSTGTLSLDKLLGGHSGLALGNCILLEESGTTDYAGTLLRYYAAEGVVQGHQVHVVGVGEQWGRDLPDALGTAGEHVEVASKAPRSERMKIAWRYESLGDFGTGTSISQSRAPTTSSIKAQQTSQATQSPKTPKPFCHSFDLTKRLAISDSSALSFMPIRPTSKDPSAFPSIIESLKHKLSSSPPETVHRIIVPGLLSPIVYPACSSNPQHVLQFLHALRSLLRQYHDRVTAMLSLPLALYPRSMGLVRFIEIISDGVIELVPFPHTMDEGPGLTTSGAATAQEDKPQGLVKVHKLPVVYDCGSSNGTGIGDDLAFTVSRRKFVITPFSLPPIEGDVEAQKGEAGGAKKLDLDF